MIEIDEEQPLKKELWIELVKFRAGYVCQRCGEEGGSRKTSAHHINHDSTDNRLSNGEALCSPCHGRHHREGFTHSPETRAKIGDISRGRKATAEARANMSAAQKRSWQTREITPEIRARLSANGKMGKGHKHSDEARANMSAAQKGRTVSPETRAKISAALMGNSNRKGT